MLAAGRLTARTFTKHRWRCEVAANQPASARSVTPLMAPTKLCSAKLNR